ncbi:ATP-binding protein [Lentzea sp. NPDC004782]|uniref:ATP-binding protein n=1 Tax=Lentzea sp. NPDC004782 TaxID=3154458 RepID=UPI0033B01B51
MTAIRIETTDLAGVLVAAPVGRLELVSYASLRDGLLKLAVDEPLALVVRLDDRFEVPSRAMLAVFTTVWMKVSQWPGIPLALVTDVDDHLEELRTSGVSRFIPTTRTLPEALRAVEQPPERRFRRVVLPDSPAAPMMARAAVREACERWELQKISDDAVLVVSELVENAVRHARSSSTLRIELRPRGLSLAVRDDDPSPPVLEPPEPDVPGHRGVQLVDRISVAWGFAPSSGGGKIVWAVLGLREGE